MNQTNLLETYIFHQGSLPRETVLDFEPAIFNLPEFFLMKEPTGWLSFHILNQRNGSAAASFHFHVKGKVASSPVKAPFGSLECTERINPRTLFDFLRYVEAGLKANGVEEVYLTNAPRTYSPSTISLLESFLLNQKWVVSEAETGATLNVDQMRFADKIRHAELLRYRQARNAGLRFRAIPEGDAGKVYRFISACHQEKGYKISIDEAGLTAAVAQFPKRYLLFGIFDGSKMIAASVSILVRKNILYNFLVNHDRKYNQLSPPVMLMEGLYDYCRDHAISLLDMGTSALCGNPNFSLLDFKMHLAASPTTKLSFSKKII